MCKPRRENADHKSPRWARQGVGREVLQQKGAPSGAQAPSGVARRMGDARCVHALVSCVTTHAGNLAEFLAGDRVPSRSRGEIAHLGGSYPHRAKSSEYTGVESEGPGVACAGLPPDDPTREAIVDDRDGEPTTLGSDGGHVGRPNLVPAARGEVAVE